MSATETAVQEVGQRPTTEPIVNDFTIHVATVNGSGSQSSNNVLMRSIFQMGIPVSGKNMFPSNIAGLPTWFTIRANKDGWIGPQEGNRSAGRMNPETAREDVMNLERRRRRGLRRAAELNALRNDLLFYPVPFAKLVGAGLPRCQAPQAGPNMIYVGIVAELLGIDLDEIHKALVKQFGSEGKGRRAERGRHARPASTTRKAICTKTGTVPRRADERHRRQDHHRRQRRRALGAHVRRRHGGDLVSDHAVVVALRIAHRLPEALPHRQETGKATFAVVQAEDELAAIGMVLGAGWAGARSMTSTAGPGISLMAEFVGLGYFAEIPAVIWDVQRVGPSTGLPTRTAQGDMLSGRASLARRHAAHRALPVLAEECFRWRCEAFDLAEQFQTPVFVISDLDLG